MQSNYKHVDRAKLFQPFDALQGFYEYLRKKEEVIVERKCLMEDELEHLQQTLCCLQPNDMIQVVYYENGKYIKKQGVFVKIDYQRKRMQIVNQWIDLEDIVEISY